MAAPSSLKPLGGRSLERLQTWTNHLFRRTAQLKEARPRSPAYRGNATLVPLRLRPATHMPLAAERAIKERCVAACNGQLT